jgi:PKD repeat protein
MIVYTAASGATVFNTGSIKWAWGLDDWGAPDDRPSLVDPAAQQIARNVLGRAGGIPTAVAGGPYRVRNGLSVAFDGTASSDGDGAIVSYQWDFGDGQTGFGAAPNHLYSAPGFYNVTLTVTDNDGNQGSASTTATVGIYSIWDGSTTPTRIDPDTSSVELGVKFQADVPGYIKGIFFYKNASNTGTHTGSLWSASGQLLAQGTFTNETPSGWQQLTFAAPVPIQANTTYVASYHAPAGRYNSDQNYFLSNGVDNPPLRALRDGVSGGNGVYRYGTTALFPNQTYFSENYWVDVAFVTSLGPDTTPPTVTGTSPAANATGVALGALISATFSEDLDASTVSGTTFILRNSGGNTVAAAVSYDSASRTARLQPTSSLAGGQTYTATLMGGAADPRIKDAAGNALAADFSWSFTTAVPDTIPPTVTSASPPPGATGVSVGTTVTATFSESMDSATITSSTFLLRTAGGAPVSGAVSYNASTCTVTFTPATFLPYGTTFTATVKGGAADPRVKDLAGNALASDFAWSFSTPAAPSFVTIWPDSAVPDRQDPDTASVELGVKFRSDVAGYIKGIRFYKMAGTTGTHTCALWSRTGTKLASGTFTNETATGWQYFMFTTPIAINANTVYVASYHSNVGRYAVSSQYFASSGVDNPPLHALRNGVSGGNGVYRYGSGQVFPNQTYQSENYWVDVLFSTSP